MNVDITRRLSPASLEGRSIGAQVNGEVLFEAGQYEAAIAKVKPIINENINQLGTDKIHESLILVRFGSSFKLGIDYQTFEDGVELVAKSKGRYIEIGCYALRSIGQCLRPSFKLTDEDFERLWDQTACRKEKSLGQLFEDRYPHEPIVIGAPFRNPVNLPPELFCQVMRSVDPHTRLKARRVSQSWDSAIKDNQFLWYELNVHDYLHRRDWNKAFNLSQGGIRALSMINRSDQTNPREWREQFCKFVAGSSHLAVLHDEVAAFGSVIGMLETPKFACNLRELRTTCIHTQTRRKFPPDIITRSLGLFPNIRMVAISQISNKKSTPLLWPGPGMLLKLETLELIGEVSCVWPFGRHSKRAECEAISFPISCVGEEGLAKAAPSQGKITLRNIGFPIALATNDSSKTAMLESWKHTTFDFSSFENLKSLTLELDQWHPLPLLPAGLERLDINHYHRSRYTYADYMGVVPHIPKLKMLAINTDTKIGDEDSMWRRILTRSGCHLEELIFRDAPRVKRSFAGTQDNKALRNFGCSEWQGPLLETLLKREQLCALKDLRFHGRHWNTSPVNPVPDMLVESCRNLAALELEFLCSRGGLDPLLRVFINLRGLQMLKEGQHRDGAESSQSCTSAPWIKLIEQPICDFRRPWYEPEDAESYRHVISSAQYPLQTPIRNPVRNSVQPFVVYFRPVIHGVHRVS